MTFIVRTTSTSGGGGRRVFIYLAVIPSTFDPNPLSTNLNRRAKANIPVHLCGQAADMDPILEIARRHGLPVIEDACQAHGAEYKGRRAGSLGICGCFSFYPGKNLGALGEAGSVVTNSEEWTNKIRMLRDHGQAKKYHNVL